MIQVLVLIILILLNAFFAATEMAFVSINDAKVEKEAKNGNKKAKQIYKMLKEPSKFLATIQIGITLAGFLSSAFASESFADDLAPILNDLMPLGISTWNTISIVLITIILSYFTLVFGELVPKRIAMNNPYKTASTFVGLINIVRLIFYPLIKLLTISTEFICKIFNIKQNEDVLTEEDIKKMILLGQDEGILEEKEKDYILNVFNFNDIEVSNVLTPKKQVVMLDIRDYLKENILKIKKSKYSRFPVYKKKKDKIIGILNVKDLVLQHKEKEEINLKSIIRPITKVSYNEKIDDVFRYMQEKNESMCAVYKEEKFVGIVTIEDAVEEIVGNIYDEYDKR